MHVARLTLAAALCLPLATAAPAGAWSTGSPEPLKILSGDSTGLMAPYGMEVDAEDRMVVVNYAANSITVYAAGWESGDTAPVKTLSGGATGLSSPHSVAFDAAGRMYVANSGANSITVYAAGWASGNTAPVKTLSGGATGVNFPLGVALDAAGRMYVANNAGRSVTVYAADWAGGNTAPERTIAGATTGLNAGAPKDIAIDAAGLVYVGGGSGGLRVFAAGAGGDVAPIKAITTSAADGVTLDASGRVYTTDYDDSSVAIRVYAADWTSGATPIKTLGSGASGLGNNHRAGTVAFDSAGVMYVPSPRYGGAQREAKVFAYASSYQTVTVGDLPDVALTAGTVEVSATASGGGAVTVASLTPDVCTVAGTTITLVIAGTCTVRATQAGSADWNPTTADRSFTVTAPAAAETPTAPRTPATGATPGAIRPTVAVERTRVRSGRRVGVTLRVANTGGAALAAVRACLRVPDRLEIVGRDDRTACFALGDIAAGASASRRVELRAANDRRATARVTLTARATGVAAVRERSARLTLLPQRTR